MKEEFVEEIANEYYELHGEEIDDAYQAYHDAIEFANILRKQFDDAKDADKKCTELSKAIDNADKVATDAKAFYDKLCNEATEYDVELEYLNEYLSRTTPM